MSSLQPIFALGPKADVVRRAGRLIDKKRSRIAEPAINNSRIGGSRLKGIIFGPTGIAMSPTHTRKNGRLYRYYLSQSVLKQGAVGCPVARVPAAEIEKIVIDQVRLLLLSPEIIVQTWRTARKSIKGLTESDVRSSLLAFEPLWNELFPAEQSRIIELLVERV